MYFVSIFFFDFLFPPRVKNEKFFYTTALYFSPLFFVRFKLHNGNHLGGKMLKVMKFFCILKKKKGKRKESVQQGIFFEIETHKKRQSTNQILEK